MTRPNVVSISWGSNGRPKTLRSVFQPENEMKSVYQVQSMPQMQQMQQVQPQQQPAQLQTWMPMPPQPLMSMQPMQPQQQPAQLQTWMPMPLQPQSYSSWPPIGMAPRPMPPQVFSLPPLGMAPRPMPPQVFSLPPLQMAPQSMQSQVYSWQPLKMAPRYHPLPIPMPMPMQMPIPMQQVEETRVIQSINQNPDGTSDYITIPKSMFDQILREKHFKEVPANCDLKYSLTQNNHGQMNYNFYVIQRPEIKIASNQEPESPLYHIPTTSLCPVRTMEGFTPDNERKMRVTNLSSMRRINLFPEEPNHRQP